LLYSCNIIIDDKRTRVLL